MGDFMDIEQRMLQATTRWGMPMKRKTHKEACSPCPFCGGNDRFLVFSNGGYYCRRCESKGWLDDNQPPPTQEQLNEWKIAALAAQVAEHEKRIGRLEQMHACQDHETYHNNLVEEEHALDYWLKEGLNYHTINDFKLGWCPACPLYTASPSYTIPVLYRGKLFNIKHRLQYPPGKGDKYRPHITGLPVMIFNADALDSKDKRQVVIVEGEKKAMVVQQETGLPTVGVMGAQGFKQEWVKKFDGFSTVSVVFDPDALEQGRDVAKLFGNRGRFVPLSTKPDDFFVRYGGTPSQFNSYLMWGEVCP